MLNLGVFFRILVDVELDDLKLSFVSGPIVSRTADHLAGAATPAQKVDQHLRADFTTSCSRPRRRVYDSPSRY